MMEYTRRITGVIENFDRYPEVSGKAVGDIVAEMIGKHRKFAGTISICITDLTEDTGAVSTGTDGLVPEPDALSALEQPADQVSAGYTPCGTEYDEAEASGAATLAPEEGSDPK